MRVRLQEGSWSNLKALGLFRTGSARGEAQGGWRPFHGCDQQQQRGPGDPRAGDSSQLTFSAGALRPWLRLCHPAGDPARCSARAERSQEYLASCLLKKLLLMEVEAEIDKNRQDLHSSSVSLDRLVASSPAIACITSPTSRSIGSTHVLTSCPESLGRSKSILKIFISLATFYENKMAVDKRKQSISSAYSSSCSRQTQLASHLFYRSCVLINHP